MNDRCDVVLAGAGNGRNWTQLAAVVAGCAQWKRTVKVTESMVMIEEQSNDSVCSRSIDPLTTTTMMDGGRCKLGALQEQSSISSWERLMLAS